MSIEVMRQSPLFLFTLRFKMSHQLYFTPAQFNTCSLPLDSKLFLNHILYIAVQGQSQQKNRGVSNTKHTHTHTKYNNPKVPHMLNLQSQRTHLFLLNSRLTMSVSCPLNEPQHQKPRQAYAVKTIVLIKFTSIHPIINICNS